MKILTPKKVKGIGKRMSSVKTNIYCYAVIKGAFIKNELFKGIDDRYELYSIPHKDISMVVSNVPQSEFSERRLKDAVEDIMWLGQYAVRHEEIVESIMKAYTPLLPMKFCTIYEEEARIKMLLESRYSGFADLLAYLKDKEEYGVKIYLNKTLFKKWITSNSNKPAKTGNRHTAGRDYLLEKSYEKELEETIIKELSSRKKAMQFIISQWAIRSVPSVTISNEGKIKDEMLACNESYLVEKRYLVNFHSTLKELNDKYGPEGFRIETTGPWPCYNFIAKVK